MIADCENAMPTHTFSIGCSERYENHCLRNYIVQLHCSHLHRTVIFTSFTTTDRKSISRPCIFTVSSQYCLLSQLFTTELYEVSSGKRKKQAKWS
jgi:hypothetical protein